MTNPLKIARMVALLYTKRDSVCMCVRTGASTLSKLIIVRASNLAQLITFRDEGHEEVCDVIMAL